MIYFDNNATTRVAREVYEAMTPYLTEHYGNPSSAYEFGRNLKPVIQHARESISRLIGSVDAREVVFTSGGTESDNWSILGALEANAEKKHIITTKVEHEAVRKLCQKLETRGYRVTWLEVDGEGFLDLEALRSSLREDTAVVSVMLANNETGILFPVREIGRIVKESSSALFHVDGVNAVGKVAVNLRDTEIDLFSISAHKLYGPKGIGALYVREGIHLPPFFTGGGQETGRRAGTDAVHQIAGFEKAADMARDLSSIPEISRLRDKLESEILRSIPNATLNGTPDRSQRLPNTSNISFENTNGEAILARLNDLGICVSTGSACNSANHQASAVLQAMEVPYTRAMGSIRFSLGRYNVESEIDFLLAKLPEIIGELRLPGASAID